MSTGAAVLVLLASVGLLFSRRAGMAIGLCAGQAVCASVALAATGSAIAAVALALNGIIMPLACRHVQARFDFAAGRPDHWLIAGALVLVAGAAKLGADDVIAIGILVMLLGFLRSFRSVPTLGLLSAQNGLVLIAAAIPGLPQQDALLAAVPFVPAMMLAETWLLQ